MSNFAEHSRNFGRRAVLKMTTAVAAATFFVPTTAKLARASEADVDVIVIGAGMAGLTAAKALQRMDYEVLVLEAANHTGGRLLTDWSLGAPFEVGAGWIHGPDGNPLTDLAEDMGAETYVTDDDSLMVFDKDGAEIDYDLIEEKYNDLLDLYQRIDDAFDGDQALDKAIRRISKSASKDPILKWMFSAFTEFDTGGPIEKLSAYYFDEDEAFDGDDVVLTTGYDEILKPIKAGLDIRLNHRVDRVEYEAGDGASVYVGDREFESSFVVCTVPLGVLKAGSIAFDPQLPKKHRNSFKRISMGNVTKLALKFEEAFWPTDVQYFGVATEEKGRWNYWLNYRTFSDENILLGLSIGDYPAKVEKFDDAEMIADGMNVLRTMFGDAVSEPTAHLATRWSTNPNAFGAYSYSAVGIQPSDYDRMTKPVRDVIVFAGEHTTFAYHATVHGAHLSGLKAARIIDEQLAD